MESIIINWVISKIFALICFIVAYKIYKELSQFITIFVVLVGCVIMFVEFLKPSLSTNIKTYRNFNALNQDNVEMIQVRDEQGQLLKEYKQINKLNLVLKSLVASESYFGSAGHKDSIYELVVYSKEGYKIEFVLRKTDFDYVIIKLKNRFEPNNDYTIGSYQNNQLLKTLNL
jgi:hypothetical protein